MLQLDSQTVRKVEQCNQETRSNIQLTLSEMANPDLVLVSGKLHNVLRKPNVKGEFGEALSPESILTSAHAPVQKATVQNG